MAHLFWRKYLLERKARLGVFRASLVFVPTVCLTISGHPLLLQGPIENLNDHLSDPSAVNAFNYATKFTPSN